MQGYETIWKEKLKFLWYATALQFYDNAYPRRLGPVSYTPLKTVGVGKIMQIEFGDFEFTECWDGVLYKKLSGYHEMTDWEIQTVLDFIKYEKDNGRE